MHDAHASEKGHVDCHVGLGDGVHGRGGEGRFEGDGAGEFGGEVDAGGGEADVTREEEEVVVRLALEGMVSTWLRCGLW